MLAFGAIAPKVVKNVGQKGQTKACCELLLYIYFY